MNSCFSERPVPDRKQKADTCMQTTLVKILDLKLPEITSYPIYANPCAIMQVHEETREWILSSFIQLCSNLRTLNFYDFSYRECPFLKVQRIPKTFLKDWGMDVLSFIIYSIQKEQYVYLLVKKKHISAYYPARNVNRECDEWVHDLMIYGYDIHDGIFYIADNFRDGKYAFAICTFEEMRRAIDGVLPQEESRGGFNGNIELLEFDQSVRLNLSVQRILEALKDYQDCRPTGMWNIMSVRNYNRNRRWYFGQDCYEYMINQTQNLQPQNARIQDYHLLWEHKKHLKSIFSYLLEKEYISDSESGILQGMEEVVQQALCARNLVLKYRLTGREDIKSRVEAIYRQVWEIENALISEVIEKLKVCDMERLMTTSGQQK